MAFFYLRAEIDYQKKKSWNLPLRPPKAGDLLRGVRGDGSPEKFWKSSTQTSGDFAMIDRIELEETDSQLESIQLG